MASGGARGANAHVCAMRRDVGPIGAGTSSWAWDLATFDQFPAILQSKRSHFD